jgi:uncharacterized spore protein YtfJ
MADSLKDFLESIIGELKHIADTETIVGKPVVLGRKTVVPVSRIMVGFGVGGGVEASAKKGEGFGGAGGGGVRVEPVGFIVLDDDRVSFLPSRPGKFDELIDAIPNVLTKFKGVTKGKDENGDRAAE